MAVVATPDRVPNPLSPAASTMEGQLQPTCFPPPAQSSPRSPLMDGVVPTSPASISSPTVVQTPCLVDVPSVEVEYSILSLAPALRCGSTQQSVLHA
jgi:hypothetical protein